MNAARTPLALRPPFEGYAYAYPHKTAYRALEPARTLDAVWAGEDRRHLFLYLHVPFCEMRCGFCNLFTEARPKDELVTAWLGTMRRAAKRVKAALGDDARFVRRAIGGGTPTHLAVDELAALFELAAELGGEGLPTSIELSPETTTPEKVALLAAHRVTRVSLGVQSFFDEESRAIGRPQSRLKVDLALDRLRSAGFPTLNVDLVYGIPGQTSASWRASLDAALRFRPEELYLYPLYVRPLTGLGKKKARRSIDDVAWDEQRLQLRKEAKEHLLEAGYVETSLRMFRRIDAPGDGGLPYRCQDDGMVGLGVGARSYTRRLHYASEYAVGARGVHEILARWAAKTDEELGTVDYGFELDDDERQRRFIIQSLLQAEGLELEAYRARFGGSLFAHHPGLRELVERGLATLGDGRLVLTEDGLLRSDAIGPWLYSPEVAAKMEAYELT